MAEGAQCIAPWSPQRSRVLALATFVAAVLPLAGAGARMTARPTAANPPVVAAGLDRTTTQPNPFRVTGAVHDDGLPAGALTLAWTQVSGPGPATFATPTQEATDVTFSAPGAYVLRLTASDGALAASADLTVTVIAANEPPVVDAGPNLAGIMPGPVTLQGRVTDDGRPEGSTVTAAWTQVSGPGTVTFTDATAAVTDAAFTVAGTYVLRLTGSDGHVARSADVVVEMTLAGGPAPDNRPPVVSAGPSQSGWLGTAVTLGGAASDDGLPAGSTLTVAWSVVSGPGAVTFGSASQATTTASFAVAGTYVLRLTASDWQLTASADTVVTVTPPGAPNAAPAVRVSPAQAAIVLPDATLTLDGDVTDDGLPAGGSVSAVWDLVAGPAPVTFTPQGPYGVVASFSAPGNYLVRLTASDTALSASTVAWVMVLATPPPANQPPVVSAGPAQTVRVPAAAPLTGSVSDDGLPAGGTLAVAWSQVSGPGTVTFAAPTQAATSSSFNAPGAYVLRLTASDGELQSTADVAITVVAGNQTPLVSAGPSQTLAYPTRTTTLAGTVSDDGLPEGAAVTASWSVVAGAGTVTFGAPDQATTTATFGYPGTYVLRLTARDTEQTASADVTVTVGAAPGAAPTVAAASPADGATITAPTAISGDVTGGEWQLAHRQGGADGTGPWTVFATGTGPVNGSLATFDPTLLLNGTYALRLTATTAEGTATEVITVSVEKNLKVGNFTVAFTDLSVPVAGLPLTVARTYDSRDKSNGDFGVGWTVGVANVRVEKSRVLGRHWAQTSTGGWFPSYCLEPTKPAFVTLTFPDGQVYRFRAAATPQCQAFYPLQMVDFTFVPEPGTRGTLQALDAPAVIVQHSEGPTDLIDLDLNVVDPRQFRFTTDEGVIYDLRQGTGVERITDRNGNTLTVSRDGIVHSSGKSVVFTRDAAGRITRMEDPLGNALTYEYDARGDLVAVVDRTSNRTTFAYNARHDLLDIVDPRGVRPLRNEYDDSGRLRRHLDAYGKVIEYTHRLGEWQELITDRLGGVRLLEYDDRGNVVQETDPAGKVTLRTYDARDNKTSETDPNGHTTTYVYDGLDNLLSTTDPLGHTTTTTYNARHQVLTQTDARGGVTTNGYDARGNLQATTDAAGKVTSYTYDGAGNVLTETDALTNVTRYEYDAAGNRTQQTDALGYVTNYTFDATGNKLSETRTTDSGVETLTTGNEYDPSGRLVKVTHPDGSVTRTVYNALGKPEKKVDQLGRITSYAYDDLGRVTTTTYPDGTTEIATYDAEGRKLTGADRGGRITSFAYDPLGRLTQTTFVDGAFTTSTYDEAGKLIAATDARGHTTTFRHDEAGRQTRVVDPLGHATVSGYDAVGNRTSQTDPKEQSTVFEYDLLGRLTRTVFPDGTERTATYDEIGRRVADTDQAGRMTAFEYDALGRLTKVTDAAKGETTYGYDELGNRTRQTDANGHTTRFAYDALGREVARTLPDGSVQRRTYDAAGNQLTRTDFASRTTTYTYDADGRPLTRSYPDGSGVVLTYTATGRRASATDARGTTSYGYDDRDRLTTLTYPDGRALEYGYDAAGNRTAMTAVIGATRLATGYTYDPAGRLDAVTDPRGGVYRHGYDANGNRASLAYPNGVTTAYAYDANNRLAALTTTHVASSTVVQGYAYTVGPTGNRTRIDEHDGTVRAYGYDVLYRLTRETITGGPLPAYERSFTYDPVGNRVTQTSTGQGAVTVDYAYDARDRLQTENGLAYSFDVNGNLVGKDGVATYVWDCEDRLIEVRLASGAVVEHQYDVDGTRVRTTVTSPAGAPDAADYLVNTAGAMSHVVAETDATGAVQASYIRGDDLVAVQRAAQVRYVHADGLGSIRRLTDETGAATDAYTYTAFGETLEHAGTDPQPYQFAGEPYDPNTGFYYNRERWLDPNVGGFVSVDPQQGAASEPLSLHRYLYSAADPVGHIDPSGREYTLSEVFVGLTIAASLTVAASRGLETALRGGSTGDVLQTMEDPLAAGLAVLWGGLDAFSALIELRALLAHVPRYSGRFPVKPSELFPENYSGLKTESFAGGKIRWEVEAGGKPYRVEYHPQHGGDDHYPGEHYHVFARSSNPPPGKKEPIWYRLKNLDPDTNAKPGGGTFAPRDLLPTWDRTR